MRRRSRRKIFTVLAVLYAALTLAVIFRSPVITVDRNIRSFNLAGRWPEPYGFVNTYVMLGQRAPSTLAALPYLCWLSWRQRSWHPLVTLACALLLLNVSVGAVKIGLGRIGPHHDPHAHAIFAGGDIYPSGHTSNAVVLFGVLAYLATRYRRRAIAACVFIAGTVGLSTLYLNTHWLSDVIGGWLAGGLVLLSLPAALARVEAWSPRMRGCLTYARSRLRDFFHADQSAVAHPPPGRASGHLSVSVSALQAPYRACRTGESS